MMLSSAVSVVIAVSQLYGAAQAAHLSQRRNLGSDTSQRDVGTELFGRTTTNCGTSGPASCHNTTIQTNLCCFEAPGVRLLVQTQFWDTNPSTGPSNSWTIHGLWPGNCDLTYDTSCDPSRDYTDITGLLNNAGQQSLVSYMNTYWVPNSGTPESFWEHEWSTHGTCYSTLRPQCITGYTTGEEAVIFFERAVGLFQTLPTYTWLANAVNMITIPQNHALNQIYWYFNLKGSLIDGQFVPISAPRAGSCPSTGIKYLPRTKRSPSRP
ncbi:ribonuclease T2-like protein [Cantharellus anzutake]|uniref:ribonuclease T2-like protein n=1 Tax=Cantharellus anzutake TaxID=1750568 RepID=UPI0019066FF6|nr:ribonuclease T2-like protein [Cantharellus anzutake]KAF8337430.1 ribonuclease T2-like protein [Cantharellus anzutake]